MKKQITIMAAAASALLAFGALGDVSAPPAGFESYNSGDGFVPSVSEGGSTYWYASAVDDTNIITNYAESGTSVPELVTGVVRPDGMKENDAYPNNSNFLSLETSTPLFRSVQANSQDGTFTGSTIGDGIYLDTLVKFTASEEEFKDGALESNVDKIAIEYVDQTNDETIENPIKAFVIRAGYIGSDSLFQTNYYAYLTDDKTFQNFDVNAWHRLTVRTIANIGGNNVGFIVYLDQKPLAYDEDCGDNFSPSTDAQNYYNDEIHAVYPSAVDANITGGDQIAAVAFSGTGAIDDVVFTTEAPEFITASESVVVPFVADAGVTAISVLPDGAADAILVDMTADTLVAVLPAQTTAFTVTATIDTDGGYEFVSMTVGESVYNTNPASVTGYAGDAITVTTVRNNFNLFDANGDPIQGTFQTLTEALAKEGVAKIVLAHHYEVTEEEANSEQEIYSIEGNLELNLNGKTLDGGEGNGFELFYVTGSLKVIDSVGGGKIVYGGDVFGSEGSLLVGDVSGDNGVTIDGVLFNATAPGYVIRANVLAEGNTDGEGAFLWNSNLGDGENIESDANLVGDYWVVTPTAEPPAPVIPTYTLTIPTVANASAVVTSNSVVVADLTAIPSNTEVLVTWSAESGYKITAGETETITMDSNKEAATPTVSAITYATLTITQVANCTIVVSNTTDEVTTGATFDVDDSVELTVYRTPADGYELDNCAATETITMNADRTVTAAVKQSGGSYPSYIDEITDPEKKAAYKEKYDTWATYAEVDVATGEVNEDAFLLNCKPSEVAAAKAAFKFTSISYDATKQKWVAETTTSYNEREFNGTVTVKQYSDVGCTTESETGTFFKAVLQ